MLNQDQFQHFFNNCLQHIQDDTSSCEQWNFPLAEGFDFDFFDAIDIYPKVFWSSKHTKTQCFAFGESAQEHGDIDFLKDKFPHLHFFSYQTFKKKPENQGAWGEFNKSKTLIPQFLIFKEKDRTQIVFQDRKTKPITFSGSEEVVPYIIKQTDLTDKDSWLKIVKEMKTALLNHEASKVVLANEKHLELSSSLPLAYCLQALEKQRKNSYLYCLALEKGSFFLSATPETLIQRNQNTFTIDVLAGTRSIKDQKHDLLTNSKDIEEHNIVKDYILSLMGTLGIQATLEFENKLLALSHLIHLHSQIQFNRSSHIKMSHIIELLHPTPAVAGVSKESALELIDKLEGFGRGLYAAPFGYFSQDRDDVAVSIRSFLVQQNDLYAFAGCGLVKDSNEQEEWNELNNKFLSFLSPLALKENI